MRVISLLLSLLLTSTAWAGDESRPLQRGDFAYGIELAVNGQGALYGLAVPPQVYQACTRADLGDLRVFNGQGVVPHLLRAQVRTKNSPEPVLLPFFPLVDGGRASGVGKGMVAGQGLSMSRQGGTDLHIVTNDKGTIIDFHQGQEQAPGAVVTAYVIDTTGLHEKADWLEFAWTGQPDHFSTSIRLESSDDLNSWRTMVSQAALAELRFGGHDLLRNRIAVPVSARKYLRLSWPAGQQGVVLSAIKAGYDQEDVSQPRTILYLGGEDAPVAEPGKVVFHYSSDGFFPVDQLSVRLPQQNSLAQVVVSSRAGQEGPWRQRAEFLAYQLVVDGVSLNNGSKHIGPCNDRFWRVEMDGAGSSGVPMLELGWLPQQLVFVAQGQGPYTLAYGRAGLGPERSPVDRLLATLDPLQEKNLIRAASAGPQIILGGKGQLLATPELPWRRWLLWASLVSGVLIIGTMARQLLKDMQTSGNAGPR